MTTYYHGSATYLFEPLPGSGIGSNRQFVGTCAAYHQVTSKDTALSICENDAKTHAGDEYKLLNKVSENIQKTEVDN